MSEMLERAKAAALRALEPLTEPGVKITLRELADAAALAVVTEIREPTKDMLQVGGNECQWDGDFNDHLADVTWKAMVDVILK